jgi:hypothetical protein
MVGVAEHYDYGNEVLYQMCLENPRHDDLRIVEGKFWLIGRSYAAAIERKAGSDFKLSQGLLGVKNSDPTCFDRLDASIENLHEIGRIDDDSLLNVIIVHKQIVELIKDIIRNGGGDDEGVKISKRSLASKYLHFHAPNAFFIYDHKVIKELTSKVSLRIVKQKYPLYGELHIDQRKDIDKEYADFLFRVLYLRDFVLRDFCQDITPRWLDTFLYNHYDDADKFVEDLNNRMIVDMKKSGEERRLRESLMAFPYG